MTSKIHHLGDHLDNNNNNNKVWFTRAIFIWQVFLTSFICPCEQGKLPFFHLSSFYLFKITKKLAKKKLAKWNLPNETCRATKLAHVYANANDKFFFDKFYLTSFYLTSFICLCGRTKLPVFPLSCKLVQRTSQLVNCQNKRASGNRKRKSQTNTTTPVSPQPEVQFQTKLARL